MEIGHSHKMRKIILWMKAILLLTVMTMTMLLLMKMLMMLLMMMAVVLGAGECEGQPESGETAASITPSAHSAVDTISHNISNHLQSKMHPSQCARVHLQQSENILHHLYILQRILHHLQPVHHLHNYTFFSATIRNICIRTFENASIFGKLFGVRHFPFTPSHETCDHVFLQCDLGRPC